MQLTEQNRAEIKLIAQEVVKEFALRFDKNNEKITDEIRVDIKSLPALIKDHIKKDFILIDVKLDAIESKFDGRIDSIIAEKDANRKRIEDIESCGYAKKSDIYKICSIILGFCSMVLYLFEKVT